MGWLIAAMIVGCLPGAIAAFKGRSFGAWWFYGALLFPLALLHVAFIGKRDAEGRDPSDRVPCPHCRELVWPKASLCPHCKSDLTAHWPTTTPLAQLRASSPIEGVSWMITPLVGLVAIVGIGLYFYAHEQVRVPSSAPVASPVAVAPSSAPNENQLAFVRDLGSARAGAALCGLEIKPGASAEEAGALGIKPYDAPWFGLIAGAESAAKTGAKDKALFCKAVKAQFTGQAVRKWLVVAVPR